MCLILKAIGDIYFTKKWRAETLQPGLEFDNFKPQLKSGIPSKPSRGLTVRILLICYTWFSRCMFVCVRYVLLCIHGKREIHFKQKKKKPKPVRVFGGDDGGFLKQEVKTYWMASISPLNSPFFFPVLTYIYRLSVDAKAEVTHRRCGRFFKCV